jgi:hypothetical protein
MYASNKLVAASPKAMLLCLQKTALSKAVVTKPVCWWFKHSGNGEPLLNQAAEFWTVPESSKLTCGTQPQGL